MDTQTSLFGIRTSNPRVRRGLVILAHIIFWGGFIYLPYLLLQNNDSMRPPREGRGSGNFSEGLVKREDLFFYIFLFNSFLSICLFYFNSEWLMPRFLKRKNAVLYLILAIAAVVIGLTANYYFRYFLLQHSPRTSFHPSTFYLFVSVFAVSGCYRLLNDFQRDQRLRTEREKVRLQSELSFLRSQISPHFMFNLMNSLAALARKKSDLVEPMIVKMSDLLRYMLYDSDDARVPIDREINYLNSYIDLQKMRFGNHVKIEADIAVENNDIALEPMLLIPFVENAFKHGTGYIREPKIEMKLSNQGSKLIFIVQNRHNSEFKESKDDSSGIGLANVRRRLELLYPNDHSLKIDETKDTFITHLEINTDRR